MHASAPLPGSKPCDGPLCKQSPAVPMPVPAPPATPERNHQEIACLSDLTSQPYRSVSRLQTDRCSETRDGFELEVDRPPC